MVAAGITVHYVYAAAGLLPTARPSLGAMVHFEIDYTFWLNLVLVAAGGLLVYLHVRDRGSAPGEGRAPRPGQASR